MIFESFLLFLLLGHTHAGGAARQVPAFESINGQIYVSEIGPLGPSSFGKNGPAPPAPTSCSLTTATISSTKSSLKTLQHPPSSSLSPWNIKSPAPGSTGSDILTATSSVKIPQASSSIPSNTIRPTSSSTWSGISSDNWPASITYRSQSNGEPVIVICFTTTGSNGVPSITSIIPSQSLLSATAGVSSLEEIAVSITGTTTIIEVSALPLASTFSEISTIQTETKSGTKIVYSPTTLAGYSNKEPIEISTAFVETVNGQTTTQWGWWLIGPYGYIDPPNNRPWRDPFSGIGFGCIAGPSICNTQCGDITVGGNWFIHLPSKKCLPSITGPPGWPGGPIIFGSSGPDDPPYPVSPGDPDTEDPGDCDEDGVECSMTTTKSTTNTTPHSSSPTRATSSIALKTPYLLVAAATADQSLIMQQLQNVNAESDELYQPDVGATEFTNGTWVSVEFTPPQASSFGSWSDIALIMKCASATVLPDDSMPTTVSVETTVTLITLSAEQSPPAKRRRLVGDQSLQAMRRDTARDLTNTSRFLDKREPGTRLVRQVESPKDLSVLAWASDVPSVDNVDYVMEESRGEFTWVYVPEIDKLDAAHWEFQTNWEGTDSAKNSNIDPDWIFAPEVLDKAKEYAGTHGTCVASKICGKKSGSAKRTILIPVVFIRTYSDILAAFQMIELDIKKRRGYQPKQTLAGKTVVSISWDVPSLSREWDAQFRNTLRAIMNLGVVVVTSAGNEKETYGFINTFLPSGFALWGDFPLIRAGAVDTLGDIAEWSQEGDIYTVGVDIDCALTGSTTFEETGDGTSSSTAIIAGLVLYLMGLKDVPFAFGQDITQYSKIVKDYFVTGPGGIVREGGQYRLASNGLNGTADTVCPLSLQKRQGQPKNICQSHSTSSPTSPSISTVPSVSPTQTPDPFDKVYLGIYYSLEEPCERSPCDSGLIYYVYQTGYYMTSLPIHECGGALGQGNHSVQFQIFSPGGIWESLTYTPTSAGIVTGNGLVDPVTCSDSFREEPVWTCSNTKRSWVPDGPVAPHLTYYQWATCALNFS